MNEKIIEQIARVIANNESDNYYQFETVKDKVDEEIIILEKSEEQAVLILRILFGDNIVPNVNVFKYLSKFQLYLGYGKSSKKLVEILLLRVIQRLSAQEKKGLFHSLLDCENSDFWVVIRAFPVIIPNIHFDPSFFADLIVQVRTKIGADLAGGPFFESIELLGENSPAYAFEILTILLNDDLTDFSIDISVMLLGSIRIAKKDSRFNKKLFKQIENKLKSSEIIQKRRCYYRSWGISFTLGNLSIVELQLQLEFMLKDIAEEAFGVLYKCLVRKSGNEKLLDFYFDWLKKNSSLASTPFAKYFVVTSIWTLLSTIERYNQIPNYEAIKTILTRIQPISKENHGTWQDLEYVFVDVLHKDKNIFLDLFVTIYSANAIVILELIEENKLEYLLSGMNQANIEPELINLFFSKDDLRRKLGFTLFHHFDFENKSFKQALHDEIILKKILLNFICDPMLGEDASRFLLLMLPIYESSSFQIQKKFEDEMVLQAINYPGICLDNWKLIKNPSEMLKKVIYRGELYFQQWQSIRNHHANSFSFANLIEANHTALKERSRAIDKATKEQSLFLKFVSTLDVIYGDKTASMMGGQISEPMVFSKFSHSIEFPRLEEIDPEGMAIRRFLAFIDINKIEDSNKSSI